ncbi:MAG: ABC transporter substrate-binding protein [Dehalococcoidia bacterium]
MSPRCCVVGCREGQTSPKFASGFAAQYKGMLDGVEVVDPLTATFHMAKVDVAFPSKLTAPMLMPLKYLQASDAATLAAKPVGSGPFQFVSRTADSEIRSTRFDKFFRLPTDRQGTHIPYIKDLIQHIYPEDQARVNALQAGNIDLAYNVPSALAKSLEGQSGIKVVYLNGDQPMHIMINSIMPTDPQTGQPNPWRDQRVRLAANMAIDLPTIIKTLLTGHEKRSFGSSSVGFGYPKDIEQKAFKYDPAGAKTLLTQAGFPDGFKAVLNYPTGRWPNTVEVSQAIAGYLGKVGIQTTLQPLQYQVVTTKLKEKSLYPLTFFGMSGGNDPEPNFFNGYTDDSIYGGDPGGPELTALVQQQQSELDSAKRAALGGQVITNFYQEARWIFLYEPITVLAVSDKWEYTPYYQPAAYIDYWSARPKIT